MKKHEKYHRWKNQRFSTSINVKYFALFRKRTSNIGRVKLKISTTGGFKAVENLNKFSTGSDRFKNDHLLNKNKFYDKRTLKILV